MIEFKTLYQHLEQTDLVDWLAILPEQLEGIFKQRFHGKMAEWQGLLASLPDIKAADVDINADRIRLGIAEDANEASLKQLKEILLQFHPWRKGPYELFGIRIDTEWHSDWKWQRVKDHISPLNNRLVLDVGCGNGYHMWRMLGEGAQLVVGADPSQFFLAQFHIMKHYAGADLPIHLLPLKGEELPAFTRKYSGKGFDSVFSMGVLYHRQSPITHLQELRYFLRAGGELILETLIIDGDEQSLLLPEDRYAKMRNVWFIPSVDLLTRMLQRAGFINIRVVDLNQTSTDEQRSTEWMTYESLADFLDPNDKNKTIEGHPAPKRAVVVCNVP
ncbi:MAG TPA: tRNA 5-methoxyuridine(34)/uridine 5-oxyacetic acid(34) synthase CmoB [Leucothrix mucor]|nr:tRNA 5-methoxyuridine(34)/uridine 5-oxyacetic acid(34) synthase CmoB [Leucothrix mucor]